VVVTARDTVLAWCEARKGSDWDDIRILLRYLSSSSSSSSSAEGGGGRGGKDRLLFSNPHNLARSDGKEAPGKSRDRKNVSVKLSYDEGRTWPVNKTIEPGWSAYSDLAVTHQGTILCFYGCGTRSGFAGDALRLARFNLEWLTDGRDSRQP
jgi:hypothetical protein